MARNRGKTHFERFRAAVAAGNDAAAEALVPLLGASDLPVLLEMAGAGREERWWALRALAVAGDARALPTLMDALGDEQSDLRAVSALSLAELLNRQDSLHDSALPALATLLQDADGLVRQVAADALSRVGDAAVPVLKTALEHEEEGVRARAARALHRIGTMATALPLYHCLDDPSPLVRHYAYETLEALGLLTDTYFTPE